MTDIDIDAIRQREQAATKGPWEAAVDDHGRGQVDASVWSDELSYYIAERISSAPNHVADAEFIAHARTDVPALLAKVDELTAERDEWRGRYELAHADRLARSLERDQTIDEREYLKAQLAARDAQLTQSREQAATPANEIGTLTAENARLRQQRDGLLADLTDAGNEVDLLTAENTRLRSQAAELRALYTGLADGPPVNADWLLGELGRLTRIESAAATR